MSEGIDPGEAGGKLRVEFKGSLTFGEGALNRGDARVPIGGPDYADFSYLP